MLRMSPSFTIVAVIGLAIFGLFFLRQVRVKLPVNTLWACQVVFAVYYAVTDLCILYLSHQMQPGLLRMVPAVLLGGMMTMTGWLSALCFLGYLLGILLMAGQPLFLIYGVVAVLAAYLLSRERFRQQLYQYSLGVQTEEAAQDYQEMHLRLERMTGWDSQTQMNNRRAMSAWLEAVWPLCVRNRIPVAVIILSPDGMEKVRKQKGQDAANARLNQLAKALKPFVRRQSDFLGRYDRDKFIILYSGPSRQDTDMLLKRVKEELGRQTWADAEGETISCCIGLVYGLPKDNMVAAQWMTRADDALEKAYLKGDGAVEIEEA
jgi:diguanylate cyclase (GGDEF)-like protein